MRRGLTAAASNDSMLSFIAIRKKIVCSNEYRVDLNLRQVNLSVVFQKNTF